MSPPYRFILLLAVFNSLHISVDGMGEWYELITCPCDESNDFQHFDLPYLGDPAQPISVLSNSSSCFSFVNDGCAWGGASCVGLSDDCSAKFNVSIGPSVSGFDTIILTYANNGDPGTTKINGYDGGNICLDQARDTLRVEAYPCTPGDRQQEWNYDGFDALIEVWSGNFNCLCRGNPIVSTTPSSSLSPTPTMTSSRSPTPSHTSSHSRSITPSAAPTYPPKDTSTRDGLAVGIPLGLIVLGAGAYAWKSGITLSSLLPTMLTPPQAGSTIVRGKVSAVSTLRASQLGERSERVPILAAKI